MSVQVAENSASHSNPSENPSKKSKKRKLETPEKERSSSKKRRHAERVAQEAETLKSSEKRKEKKKKKKSKDIDTTPAQATNGAVEEEDTELPDAPAINGSGPATDELNLDLDDSDRPERASNTAESEYPFGVDFLESNDPSCFYSTRISLHVSIPAVALSTAQNSILSMHLAPLVLTYFPPAKGIILAFSDPILSAKPDFGVNLPLIPPKDGSIPEQIPEEVLSRTADEFGACWVWLTVTFLVFRPERGDKLHGWTNVTSQGFVGLISYNFFQTAVGKSRIPESWIWNGPTREQSKKKGRKARLRDEAGDLNSQASTAVEDEATEDTPFPEAHLSDGAGFFSDETGTKVPATFLYRVVDTDMVPDKDKWALSIDGSLLEEEAEQRVLAEERAKYERLKSRGRSATPGTDVDMSGGRGISRAGSAEAESPL